MHTRVSILRNFKSNEITLSCREQNHRNLVQTNESKQLVRESLTTLLKCLWPEMISFPTKWRDPEMFSMLYCKANDPNQMSFSPLNQKIILHKNLTSRWKYSRQLLTPCAYNMTLVFLFSVLHLRFGPVCLHLDHSATCNPHHYRYQITLSTRV